MNLPFIPNAFENVKAACDQRLAELYPAGIPEEVMQRYQQELSYLQESDMAANFEFHRQLCEEGKKCAQFFCQTTTAAGSILYYLLGNSFLNPMPAHYYCPYCGYYEPVNINVIGLDLPNKACPHCDCTLRADGFNLSWVSFWGLDKKRGYFDYLVSPAFFPYAKRRMEHIYSDCIIVPLSTDWTHNDIEDNASIHCCGFAVLPKGTTLDDYPELVGYLPSGERCLSYDRQMTSSLPLVVMHPHKQVHHLLQLQQKTGLYCLDISPDDIRPLSYYDFINTASLEHNTNSLLDGCTPKTYYEAISFIAATHNSYKSDEGNYRSVAFGLCSPYPHKYKEVACFTREDIHEKLIELGYDHDTAFKFSEAIRRGHLVHNPPYRKEHQEMKAEIENNTSISEDLKAYLFDCQYLCPRSHITELVIMTAMLAYYQKQDSKLYAEIVLQK